MTGFAANGDTRSAWKRIQLRPLPKEGGYRKSLASGRRCRVCKTSAHVACLVGSYTVQHVYTCKLNLATLLNVHALAPVHRLNTAQVSQQHSDFDDT